MSKRAWAAMTVAPVALLLMMLDGTVASLAEAGDMTPDANRITMPGPALGASWGITYGFFGVKAEPYMPQLRQLGGGWTKIYLSWSQVEPEKGRYDWNAVDAFVDQLTTPEVGLITVCSSSTWATRRPSPLLNASPAKDPDDYSRFIEALVRRCNGRVRYWQNDSEPNNPIFWAGTSEEFLAQLKVFYRAVKDADPRAVVVCGGYDGVFRLPGQPPIPGQERGLAFFDHVLKAGSQHFDVFDMRLYSDAYTIPDRVAFMRKKMADVGSPKPIVATEYNGPAFFEFKENRPYYSLMIEWSTAVAASGGPPSHRDGKKHPVAALYDALDTLAPQTQMFMAGCPQALEEKFARLQCRDLVMRNVLALSAGVQKTLYWDLWHDTSRRDDLMHLLYAKHRLLDYEDGVLSKHRPPAEAFQRTARALDDVELVRRIEVPEQPTIYLFEVTRRARPPLWVVWQRRDVFSGEDEPAVPFGWQWIAPGAKATDTFGRNVATSVAGGRVNLDVSPTPVFVEPTE
jgi:hypothetical protein